MIRRFLKDRRGNVAPIFAVAAVPLIASIGAAVDYTNLVHQRRIVQDALDAAALAANRLVGLEPKSAVKAEAVAFFNANIADKGLPEMTPHVTVGTGTVLVTTSFTTDTYFLGLIGLAEQTQNLKAKSISGSATYEVVMVLDNSGSMAGSKISSLKEAAKDLTASLFEQNASNPKPDPVKIGVVPFAAAVNVGSGYKNASWMDTGAAAPYHSENFEEEKSRFDLFDDINNIRWQGCVEARPHPYDTDDTTPTTAMPATMFVPMFAPDEPDDGSYANNYIDDDGGSCDFSSGSGWGGWDWGWGWNWGGGGGSGTSINDLSDAERQALVCKYDGATLSGYSGSNGISKGPNYNCTAEELQPLTTIRGHVESALAKMKADGMTNIHAGIMWGWRLLSPGEPFTGGRAYSEPDNRKILVVMTDGENTYTTYNNMNKSMYGAFGYIAKDHLGTTSSNSNTVVDKMDDRTEEACTNAKAAGITIYTVAFKVTSTSTKNMLVRCASQASMAYTSESNTELVDTFGSIARDITLLRLEK